jgi:hypothetical protein
MDASARALAEGDLNLPVRPTWAYREADPRSEKLKTKLKPHREIAGTGVL